MSRFSFIYLLLVIVALLACASCAKIENDNFHYNWEPVDISIVLSDATGNDLLDPSCPSNMLDGTTIEFRGETYTIDMEIYNAYESWKGMSFMTTSSGTAMTRSSAAEDVEMYGVYLVSDEMSYVKKEGRSKYYLLIGQIDGAEDMNEDIIITWPDGRRNVVNYRCSDHNDLKMSVKRSFRLDGVECQNPVMITR